MIVATAGHVDHGKTTLVKALTGVDTDRLDEERRRGLTIDLGFAYADHAGERWGFIDVPGHHRFVANMLAGVAAVDLALLVVAADEGPMPQTREHLEILDLLGIERGVVAMTRSDRADAATRARHLQATRELLADSPLAEAPVVAVAAPAGMGIEELWAALSRSAKVAAPRPGQGFRLAMDRAFTIAGAGVVVTGTAHAGEVRSEDHLVILPQGLSVRVRSVRAQDRAVATGRAGERLALNITGAGTDDLHRGDWLVAPALARPQQRFDARLRVLPSAQLRNGQEVHVHHGAADVLGRVTLLDGEPGRPRAHVALRSPLGVLHGDRFVLRDSSGRSNLAGGRIIDPCPPARGRRSPARLRQLDALEAADVTTLVTGLLARAPLELDLDELAWRLNTPAAGLAACAADALVDRRGGMRLRDAAAWSRLLEDITDCIRRFHREQPNQIGPGPDSIQAGLDPRPSAAALRAALSDGIRAGHFARTATRFHLPGHRPRLERIDAREFARVRPLLAATPRQPPVIHDMARTLDVDPDALTALCERVQYCGGLLRVAGNRFLLPHAVAELAGLARTVAAAAADDGFDARSFRDAAGIGRNLTIDLLEYFDRMGLTRRRGDRRWLIAVPEDIFGSAGQSDVAMDPG